MPGNVYVYVRQNVDSPTTSNSDIGRIVSEVLGTQRSFADFEAAGMVAQSNAAASPALGWDCGGCVDVIFYTLLIRRLREILRDFFCS